MRIEYLVITRQDGSFCSSVEALHNLLRADTRISITGDRLTFENGIAIHLDVQTEVIRNKDQRYFHIELNSGKDESQCQDDEIKHLNSLRRAVREVLGRIGTDASINTLWNDISLHYSKKIYPLVHEIENQMRKLIMKFMFVNVGMDWFEEKTPEDVKTQIKSKGTEKAQRLIHDVLQEADFIHLSKFLFEGYRALSTDRIEAMLKDAKTTADLDLGEMQNFVRKSNWGRFFSTAIDYEGRTLNDQWAELYRIRIKIAHNKDVSEKDYEQTCKLVSSLKGRIIEAIDKLKENNLTLDVQQKEEVVESIAMIYEDVDNDGGFANGYRRISLEHMLGHLRHSEQWASTKAGYVGLHNFVKTYLGNELLYDYATSYNMIDDLVEKGAVEKYQAVDRRTGVLVPAVRLVHSDVHRSVEENGSDFVTQ